jgi:signal transduction histidine kinase
VSPTGSLRMRFTWWFAGTLLLLYGVGAAAIWLHSRTSDHHFAVLTLKAEAEVVAAYLTATGRVDAPEFRAPEATPFPIWFRLIRGGRVIAQTPGAPPIPVGKGLPTNNEILTEWSPTLRGRYLVVYHMVGGDLGDAMLQVIAPTASLVSADRRLALALVCVGLVVIPLAALGGRRLAQRALRPLDGLVAQIRGLDSSRLSDRLELPGTSVAEVVVFAGAFNDLLGRLETSVELMRRFTADASHEIRNPLTVIRTGLEVALRRARQPEEYRALMEENLQEIRRLQAVLEGLLTLAREVPGAPYPVAKVPVDFSGLLEQTADTFSTVAAERGVLIREDIEPGLILDGDPQLIRLAAFNLIDNALKHSPAEETVRLTARAREDEIELVVADRGPGVAVGNREHLFRRFFRADQPPGAGVGGLGLSVVWWVTELHGGRVRLLETERGAAFQVVLPRRVPRGLQDAVQTPLGEVTGTAAGRSVPEDHG